jgi:hypothetical protein
MLSPVWRRTILAVLIVVLALAVLSWETASYGEVCAESNQAAQKDCAAYSIPLFIFIKIGKAFEDHNAAVTAFFTIVLAISTIALWRSTDHLWKAAVAQGRDMENSIAEAARAAKAMEAVAENIQANSKISAQHLDVGKENAARQLRAYLGVAIGHAIYQETSNNKRFEALPILINYGFSPAHKVAYWARAEILPFPLPPDFDFTQRSELASFAFTLHPRQELILNAFVDGLVDESEVEDIKRGDNKRLTIYGTVFYEDIFGLRRQTNFCQSIRWITAADGSSRVAGTYHNRHNDAD